MARVLVQLGNPGGNQQRDALLGERVEGLL
jgi:hypothetical protein